MATAKERAAAKKRSAAAKKAAKTRAANAAAAQQPQVDRGPKPPTEEEQQAAQAQASAPPEESSQKDAAVEVEQRELLEPYQPHHQPLEASGVDQYDVEADREAARTAQRNEHNTRVGDGAEGYEDERDEQRELHRRRTVGTLVAP